MATASGSVFAAGDAAVGKSRSSVCTACHGFTGVSPNDAWPNLAGQKQLYLVKQLEAFRDGSRKDPLMSPMAKPLSDEDIDNLAAYFSTQKAAAPEAALAAQTPVDTSSIRTCRSRLRTSSRSARTQRASIGRTRCRRERAARLSAQKCQLCHDLQRTLAFVRPREQWQHVVEAMNRRGAPVAPEEIPVIVNYLTKFFGPDSPPIAEAGGVQEVGMRACKPASGPRARAISAATGRAPTTSGCRTNRAAISTSSIR